MLRTTSLLCRSAAVESSHAFLILKFRMNIHVLGLQRKLHGRRHLDYVPPSIQEVRASTFKIIKIQISTFSGVDSVEFVLCADLYFRGSISWESSAKVGGFGVFGHFGDFPGWRRGRRCVMEIFFLIKQLRHGDAMMGWQNCELNLQGCEHTMVGTGCSVG